MQVVQPTFIDNVPRARECAGLWEGNASPCPQGALSLVRETDQPVMTAGQCGASNDRHGVGGGGGGDEGKPSQMLGGSGGDGVGDPAAQREEGLCTLGLEKEEELCWHQMRGGAFSAEPWGKGRGV